MRTQLQSVLLQGAAVAQHVLDVCEWNRLGEEIALTGIAVVAAQEVELFGGFDALGDDLELQLVGHRDDGGSNFAIVAIDRDVVDKTAIDFQFINRQHF